MTQPDAREAAIRARLAAATPGPWFTVDPPWCASHYDKRSGTHRTLPTYIVAGHPDPHVGKPVVDAIEIDGWEEGTYDSLVAQSDADLTFIAHAPADVAYLLEALEASRAEVERLRVASNKVLEAFEGYEAIMILEPTQQRALMELNSAS